MTFEVVLVIKKEQRRVDLGFTQPWLTLVDCWLFVLVVGLVLC